MSTRHPLEVLAEHLLAAPRFARPIVVKQARPGSLPAIPVVNISSGLALLAEVDNQPDAPYRVSTTLREKVGNAMASLPPEERGDFTAAWQDLQRERSLVELMALPALRPRFRHMVQVDAGIASVMAAGAALLSYEVDRFRKVVDRTLDLIGRPGQLCTVRQTAIRIAVSRDLVYESSASGALPAHRFGGVLRYDLAEVMARSLSLPSVSNDLEEPVARTRRTLKKKGRGKGGSVPGTGTTRW